MAVLTTYRYMVKHVAKEGEEAKLGVQYVTDTAEKHEELRQALVENEAIESALREYIGSVDLDCIGFCDVIKSVEKKEGDE